MQNVAEASVNAFVNELMEQRNAALNRAAELSGAIAAQKSEIAGQKDEIGKLNDRIGELLKQLDVSSAKLAAHQAKPKAGRKSDVIDAN